MSRPAIRHVLSVLVVLLAAAGAGFAFGRTPESVAIALAVRLAYQVRNLLRFDQWLRRRDLDLPPDVTGLWGEVVATTSRIHRRKLFHEQRVAALLREFRRMASAMPDGVVPLGRGREILWFNAAAGRRLGLRRKADRGMRTTRPTRPSWMFRCKNRGLPCGRNRDYPPVTDFETADARRQTQIRRFRAPTTRASAWSILGG